VSTLTETPPAPPEDEPSLRTSLLRSVGSAIGLVVLVAAIFGVIGMIGRADAPTPVAADLPTSEDEAATDDPGDAAAPADDAEVDDPDAEEPATDEVTADDPVDEATADPAEETADEAVTEDAADPEPEPEPEPEATQETQPPAGTIPPGDVSIQVLDGYKADGGTAARSLAHDLREAGYRVIAENQALSYERTTVLWTAGNEAAARQVAREIGAAEVREQPGNLSSAVDVHVVVGADRA
jgi:hypothetical protein